MPEGASVPVKLIATGRVYQPLTSAGRAGTPASTLGGVVSSLITTSPLPSVDDAQDNVLPAVSSVTVSSGQSGALQWTVTADVYQPPEQLTATADAVVV